MAGILGPMLGWQDNPFYKGFDQRRNAIGMFGAGLMSGTPQEGFAQGVKGAMQGYQWDQEAQRRQEEIESNKRNAVMIGDPKIRAAVEAGDMDWREGYDVWQSQLAGQQPEMTANMRDWQFAQDNPGFMDYINPQGSPDAPSLTSIYDENGREQKGYMVQTADGPQFVPVGSPKANTERAEFNVSQASAAGYADRMIAADQTLDNPALTTAQTDAGNYALTAATFGAGNFFTSEEWQQADQAQRDFINAILRRESGAVISESEFANARKQYFPQPGDSEAVIAQKAANRKNAINGVVRAAGPAYTPPNVPALYGDGAGDEMAYPQTQEDFDALPSGAIYVDPDDGMTYRKQ